MDPAEPTNSELSEEDKELVASLKDSFNEQLDAHGTIYLLYNFSNSNSLILVQWMLLTFRHSTTAFALREPRSNSSPHKG